MPSTTKAAAAAEPEVTTGFGKKTFGGTLIELPSGAHVKVRRPGLEILLKEGVIDQFDTLTGIVESETIPKAKGMGHRVTKDSAAKLAQDPEMLIKLMDTVDKVAVACIIEPVILPVPVPTTESGAILPDPTPKQIDELRDEDASYVDYVDFEDKMFVLNYAVGGTRDLETFRAESEAALGLLRDGEAAEDPTP